MKLGPVVCCLAAGLQLLDEKGEEEGGGGRGGGGGDEGFAAMGQPGSSSIWKVQFLYHICTIGLWVTYFVVQMLVFIVSDSRLIGGL